MTLGGLLAAIVVRAMLADAGVDGFWTWLPLIIVATAGPLAAAFLPGLRWRRWRFEIRDDEIDLHHGGLVARRTLVPIRRVQHVDTEAGPMRSSFDLATVSFHTAAGTTSIPVLKKGTAEQVRARVAELARTRDDT